MSLRDVRSVPMTTETQFDSETNEDLDLAQAPWREAWLLNTRYMYQASAWRVDLEEVENILSELSTEDLWHCYQTAKNELPPSRDKIVKAFHFRINQEIVTYTLCLLCEQALETMGQEREQFSQKKLANLIDVPSHNDPLNQLRKWLLGTLKAFGYIDGYEPRGPDDKTPMRIQITNKGLSFHLENLKAYSQRTKMIDEELAAWRQALESHNE